MKNLNAALAVINLTSEGAALITELTSSSNRFDFERGSVDGFLPYDREGAYATDLNNGKTVGSGGRIIWNDSKTAGPASGIWTMINQKGHTKRLDGDRTMLLAHEMFHGRDANRGLLSDIQVDGLSKREWQATYKENIVRQQLGLPLRTHYLDGDESQGIFKFLPPRLLTEKSNLPIRPSWVPKNW